MKKVVKLYKPEHEKLLANARTAHSDGWWKGWEHARRENQNDVWWAKRQARAEAKRLGFWRGWFSGAVTILEPED